MKIISLVAPMFNEEDCVDLFISEFIKFASENLDYRFELVIVDDGSTDSTHEKLLVHSQNKHIIDINIIKHKINSGLEVAIQTGLRNASGSIICTMDGDLQDPFSPIIEAANYIKSGYCIVHMCRKLRNGDSFFKRNSALIMYGLVSYASGGRIPNKDMANFKVMSNDACLRLLSTTVNVYRVDTWFIKNCNHKILYYSRVSRVAGDTKYGLYSMIKYAFKTFIAVIKRKLLNG